MEMKVVFLVIIGCSTVLAAPQLLDNYPPNIAKLTDLSKAKVEEFYSQLKQLPNNIQNSIVSLLEKSKVTNPNYWQQAASEQINNLSNFLEQQTANVNKLSWNENKYEPPQTNDINNYIWDLTSQYEAKAAATMKNKDDYRTPILKVPNQVIDHVQHGVDNVVSNTGNVIDKSLDSAHQIAESALVNLEKIGTQGIHDGLNIAKNGLNLFTSIPKLALGLFTDRNNKSA